MRASRCSLLAVLAFGTLASLATAGGPSPFTSTVDPCLVVCPQGDIGFRVVSREIAGNASRFALVTLDFSNCFAFPHCSLPPGTTENDSRLTISQFTDANGVTTFYLPMGGVCAGSTVRVLSDGILLAQRPLASPDRDGNLAVDASDEAAIRAVLGTSDAGADFDCNGIVDAADMAVFMQHRFHACPLIVPAQPRSWGTLKSIYR